ncbi:MAG TPA: L17 family ribosomal protein, partial [Candidatus Paceibacterota bacterium]
ETTEARAKELRPIIERLVTQGKGNTLGGRRLVSARLGGAPRETKKLLTLLRHASRIAPEAIRAL